MKSEIQHSFKFKKNAWLELTALNHNGFSKKNILYIHLAEPLLPVGVEGCEVNSIRAVLIFTRNYSTYVSVGAKGYCCGWPHTARKTHSVGLLWTSRKSLYLHNPRTQQTNTRALRNSKQRPQQSSGRTATGIG
jgi:hypothetical protein